MGRNISPFKKNHWVEGLRFLLLLYIAFHYWTCRYMDYYPGVEFEYSYETGGLVGNF